MPVDHAEMKIITLEIIYKLDKLAQLMPEADRVLDQCVMQALAALKTFAVRMSQLEEQTNDD